MMKFLITYKVDGGYERRILEKNSMEQAQLTMIQEMQENEIEIENLSITRIIDDMGHYSWFEVKYYIAEMTPDEFDEFMCEIYQIRMSNRSTEV